MRTPALSFSLSILGAVVLLIPVCLSDEAQEATAKQNSAKPTNEQLQFVRQKVLPLLESRCFECHKSTKKPKGGLLLTSRKAMLAGGESGTAIIPGKPDESLLVEAIRYEGFEMPPRSKMPDQEIDILVKWIADGAHWPEDLDTAAVLTTEQFPLQERKQAHWAWHPITTPPVPAVTTSGWVRTPSDAFVLAKLEAAGLNPAPDADRYTLIRRVYFDLIGLPPSIEQIESFVNDRDDDDAALAKVVDELLQSPHFGERWARHWLDLVRYAETLGHEFDYPLHNAWKYRDYVIRAFNQDVPYNQFVREHVAGDVLPQPRLHPTEGYNESVIATGFWFLCEDKHAPVDVRAEEAAKVDNQIDVFSRTFLAMTVACARCHDHKFDAISTQDYYALAGFLQSSRRETGWLDPHQAIQKRVQLLTELQTQANRIVAQQTIRADSLPELRSYALATLDAIQGEPDAERQTPADIVFADFESESLDGWEVSGAAFSSGTTAGTFPGQQPVTGFQGQRLVNSWNRDDNLQGSLTSAPFTIERAHIQFLVGGGDFKDKTCVNLVIDGKTVRTATGRNKEKLLPHDWDVSEFRGQTGHIEVIDHQGGGWGHINVDHIVFTDSLGALQVRRDIDVVAAEHDCDANVLKHWVRTVVKEQSRSSESPLSLLATLAQADSPKPVAESYLRWKRSVQKQTGNPADTTLFADLRHALPDDWFHTGPAFATSNQRQANVSSLEWRGNDLSLNSGQGISSAALSRELRGTLSSPTFELQHPEVLVRVAGENCRMRLVIDGYLMNEFSELLFKGTRQKIDTKGEFQWVRFAADVHRYQGHRAHLEFLDEGNGWFNVQEVRFANRPGANAAAEPASPVNVAILDNKDTAVETMERAVQLWLTSLVTYPQESTAALLNNQMLPNIADTSDWQTVTDNWTKQATAIPAPSPVIAITEGTPENEHIFIRGSHRNPGEVAARAILTALQTQSSTSFQGSGRLQLADQLVADENPLPARVAVNRVWHHLFGAGIVESTDNFGVLGKRPSHPELLDHLASQFRSEGWSLKTMIRSLVLSRTYRMSSQRAATAEEQDPTNLLLHRANIRRLQGEAVRDAILTVSGRLDRTTYGAPVPVHLTAFMQGRGRPGTNGPVDGNGRRSIYISVNRNFLSPFMQAFDVPAPVTTIGNRNVSNVPAQALILLNNEFVHQQARKWAEALLAAGLDSNNAVLTQAWYELFGRPITAAELTTLTAFVSSESENAPAMVSVDSLTEVCHALINSKEFLFLH